MSDFAVVIRRDMESAGLYKKSFEFVCFDGSKSIMYSQVNDDYCDCPDGSDEPGTSACPNGKFHCANKGHTPLDIPSSRVNDRICDCCDGSDEYSGVIECPNICDELGRSAREEKQRQAEIARKGFATRKTLAAEGQKLREEKIAGVAPLKDEREKLLPKKEELLQKKNTAVERETTLKDKHREAWMAFSSSYEQICFWFKPLVKDHIFFYHLAVSAEKKKEKANKMFKEIDINGDGKITLDELKKIEYLDSDHDGSVSDDEAKIFLSVDEIDADHFLNNTYERLKTEKVAYEDFKNDQAREQAEKDAQEKHEEDHDDLVAVFHWGLFYLDEDKADTEVYPDYTTTPQPSSDEENEDVMPPYDEETQKAISEAEAARKEYDELDIKISGLDSQIREAESFIEQDFGPDHAWATLKGKCFELTEQQYTYKYCPFDRTIQKDKNGYGETGLGYGISH
ncbi:EF hand [Ancylostoma duodenale]|uniref:EF hand n=1 Tax=Ancylostoma duodenale TaxID=51022 RepID=A0A0C2GUT8_9BILA|nr:EF hand [Ancylostoma duodenale]